MSPIIKEVFILSQTKIFTKPSQAVFVPQHNETMMLHYEYNYNGYDTSMTTKA